MRREWQPINITNCFRTAQQFLPNVVANSNLVLLRGTHVPLICKMFILKFQKTRFCLLLTKCDREDNGTPLQHSCLENPMDRGAWWAVVQSMGW